MNKERRRKIVAVSVELEGILEQLSELQATLTEVCDEEQDALDNLPESLRAGAAGNAREAAIEALEEALNGLDYLAEADPITAHLNEAIGG